MIRNYADHSANERTFLAWVRTAVSIVGFGLAAARIGNASPSDWSEIGLLVSGALIILIAWLRLRLLRRRIDREEELDDASTGADVLLVALVAALFLMIGLFVVHIG